MPVATLSNTLPFEGAAGDRGECGSRYHIRVPASHERNFFNGVQSHPYPGYLLHKSTGQARVRIHGRDYYLGRHNSPESLKRYRQLIAQYFAADDAPAQIITMNGTSVASLAAQYVEFAEEHFRHNPDERYRIKAAIGPLIQHYGSISVEDFTPKKLKDVRQRIIDRRNARTGKPLCQKYVNQLIAVIRKIFNGGSARNWYP